MPSGSWRKDVAVGMCVGDQTLRSRKSKYGRMEFSDTKKPCELEEQNRRMKHARNGFSLTGSWKVSLSARFRTRAVLTPGRGFY